MTAPIPRTVLRDGIKERIIERILDGTYAPGARVVESQIAQEFGTSLWTCGVRCAWRPEP